MKWFKSKLRKKIEFYIVMCNDSIAAIEKEMQSKRIRKTLNPAEYAKYSVQLNDLQSDINLLKMLL